MESISEMVQRRSMNDAARLAPFVIRPSNPITGAAIPQHPQQSPAPPSLRVI